MKHKKQYHRTGKGVGLLCGDKVIQSNGYRLSGMYVQTQGNSPDTDIVIESAG